MTRTHRRLEGNEVDYDGAPARLDYGDPGLEYAAIDGGAALLDGARRRLIRASGADAVEFLQGQLSADIRGLGDHAGCAALLLDVQGRLECMFEVYRAGDEIVLAVDAAWLDGARQGLERHRVADDCDFETLDGYAAVEVAGPQAASVLRDAGLAGLDPAGDFAVVDGEVAGHPVRVFTRGGFRVPCYDLWSRAATIEAVRAAVERAGAVRAGIAAYECVRVESAQVRYGVDIDASRPALEARLHDAISFEKGCYLGQEVIERTVSRGRLRRSLCLLAVEAEITAGAPVEGGEASERVTSAVHSPRFGPLALAYVVRESCKAGTRLHVQASEGRVGAVVQPWPRAQQAPASVPGRTPARGV